MSARMSPMNRGAGCLVFLPFAGSGVAARAGERDERVERVRVTALPTILRAGSLEHLVDDRFVREPEPGAVFGVPAGDEVPGAFGIGELPRVPLPLDPRVRRIPIHRLGLQTLLPHHRNRRIGLRQQPRLGLRRDRRRRRDRLRLRPPTASPARIASAVAGSASICLDVSNMFRAADTDVPDTAASCSAAERYPARFHVAASSIRRPTTS